MFKHIVCTITVLSATTQANDVVDYSVSNLSINTITYTGDSNSENFNYVELEGGFGRSNFRFYGFCDWHNNDSSFYKMNPSYFVSDNVYINYTQKGFDDTDTNLASTDYYAGIGYLLVDDKSFISANLNVRYSDNEFVEEKGSNGYAILSVFNLPLYDSLSLDGWADIDFNQQNEFSADGVRFIGNVGIRKVFSNDIFIRSGYEWVRGGDDTSTISYDEGVRITIGYNI